LNKSTTSDSISIISRGYRVKEIGETLCRDIVKGIELRHANTFQSARKTKKRKKKRYTKYGFDQLSGGLAKGSDTTWKMRRKDNLYRSSISWLRRPKVVTTGRAGQGIYVG